MPKRKSIYLIFAIGLIILSVVGFSALSNLNQAKISLKVLGIHKENIPKFSNIAELITAHEYRKCSNLSEIQMKERLLLENYFNSTKYTSDSTKTIKLSDIYANEGERWSSGCVRIYKIPNQKFKYLLYSENSLIICALSGGICVTPYFSFFENKGGELELIGIVSSYNTNIFALALSLKTNPKLIDVRTEPEIDLWD